MGAAWYENCCGFLDRNVCAWFSFSGHSQGWTGQHASCYSYSRGWCHKIDVPPSQWKIRNIASVLPSNVWHVGCLGTSLQDHQLPSWTWWGATRGDRSQGWIDIRSGRSCWFASWGACCPVCLLQEFHTCPYLFWNKHTRCGKCRAGCISWWYHPVGYQF